MNLSDTERRLLASGPAVVFYVVAMADGSISAKERSAFVDKWGPQLIGVKMTTNPVEQALFECLLEQSYSELTESENVPLDRCWTRVDLLARLMKQKLKANDRIRLANLLMQLANDVATSSREFLGMGKSISPSEEAVLERLNQTFTDVVQSKRRH